jgi:hypothetical protein
MPPKMAGLYPQHDAYSILTQLYFNYNIALWAVMPMYRLRI